MPISYNIERSAESRMLIVQQTGSNNQRIWNNDWLTVKHKFIMFL